MDPLGGKDLSPSAEIDKLHHDWLLPDPAEPPLTPGGEAKVTTGDAAEGTEANSMLILHSPNIQEDGQRFHAQIVQAIEDQDNDLAPQLE